MMKNNEKLEELASVIKDSIDKAVSSIEKESSTADPQSLRRCAFCGLPKIDVVIPRGRKDLLVCLPCYTAAKAIQEGDNEKRKESFESQ